VSTFVEMLEDMTLFCDLHKSISFACLQASIWLLIHERSQDFPKGRGAR